MRIALYAFSGTGNTAIALRLIKEKLIKEGHYVDDFLFKAPICSFPNPKDYDLIGIGYPIHAFNVPKPFLKFIKSFPKVSGKNYFIFKVSGEPFALNGASSAHLNDILRHKGYHLIYERHLLMPYNIMFRYPKGLEKQMYLYLDPLSSLVVKNVLAGGTEKKIRFNPFSRFLSFVLRIEWIAGPVNCKLAHVNKKKCINCNRCLRECPTNSIYLNKKGKLKIHPSCTICMRCTVYCPTDAIFFGFLNHWVVNGDFGYKSLAADESLSPAFVKMSTKGYFKHFRNYYKKQNQDLANANIPLPFSYPPGEDPINF